MNIFKKVTTPSKVAIVLSAMTVLPIIGGSAIAKSDTSSSKYRSQSAGQSAAYLGQVSKRAIASGNLSRLKTKIGNRQWNRNSGHSNADLRTRIQFWHTVALDTTALDHTTARDGEDVVSPVQQGGPTRTSRALAMVQIAVFEVVNACGGPFNSYLGGLNANNSISVDAAIAKAALKTLVSLYPDQEDRLTEIYEDDLALIKKSERRWAVDKGISFGERVANAILDIRSDDGSDFTEPEFGEGGAVADGTTTWFGTDVNGGSTNVGEWETDPNTPNDTLALGASWGAVTPFFLQSGDQFRVPEPALPNDDAYTQAYLEVASLGGSPENTNTPSSGTDETRFIGNFWGYDGVPLIGVPPRVYNQIAAQIADNEIQEPVQYARYLALINAGLADVGIAAWDSKYYYNYWRPVTGIRKDDGSDATPVDVDWNPVGVSVINTDEAIRPTPPFPAYPSGHAAFGASTFEIMRSFFGDDMSFTFISDEYDGEGVDPFFPDQPRPLVPVRFESFTQAQEQNGRSRVYNGVHWNFDDTAGQALGVDVASYLLNETQAFSEPSTSKRRDRGRYIGNNNRRNNGRNRR